MKNLFEPKPNDLRQSTNSFKFYVSSNIDIQGIENHVDAFCVNPTPKLLEGEIIITKGHKVCLFPHVTDKSKGICGTLYVTTFRLLFQVYENEKNVECEEPPHQKNLLIGDEYSICLSNIDSIYQVAGEKKRKLFPDSTLTGRVKGLQIICKNLRVLNLSFEQSRIDEGKNVTNTLLHHAFPGRHHLLFAYEYKAPKSEADDSLRQTNLFNQAADWSNELNRTFALNHTKWRVSSQNLAFQLSPTLPQWIIVPKSILDYDLTNASGAFRCNRPPIWTWSSSRGAALVRMADLLPAITDRTQENRMLENIRKSHPQLTAPSIKDLDKELPSVRDLLISFNKLRDLCTPDNLRQFKLQESHYYLTLDHTKWLQHVSSCLKIAVEAAQEIDQGTTVVLQESDGRDMSCVVASLIQLLCDPHSRTISGFQSLIQKEWVSLGHPFCKRLAHLRTNDSEQGPVFQLFLDCTWQVQAQNPTAFEFTETYLSTLWDSVQVSVFDTFLFDNEKERAAACNNQTEPLVPRSVWNWRVQFSEDDIQLFHNPLYRVDHLPLPSPRPAHPPLLPLSPSLPSLELWTQCYCRFLPLLRIPRGGPPQLDLLNRRLADDIETLLRQTHLENGVYNNSKSRKHPKMYDKSDLVDNFFPFSFDTSSAQNALINSSILSDADSQSVLNLTA